MSTRIELRGLPPPSLALRAGFGSSGPGTGDGVGDIRCSVARVDSHATRFFADTDLDEFIPDIVSATVFNLNYRYAIRLSIDDYDTRLDRKSVV